MTIKEEFDNSYVAWVRYHQDCSEWEAAQWAAKWMAERCAKEVDTYPTTYKHGVAITEVAKGIRKFAKGLE